MSLNFADEIGIIKKGKRSASECELNNYRSNPFKTRSSNLPLIQ